MESKGGSIDPKATLEKEHPGLWQNINLESAAKSGVVGAVGVTTAMLTGGGSVALGGGAMSTLLPATYSAISSNAAAFALYGEDYLNYLSESLQSNEVDKVGIFPGYDLPGIEIIEKEKNTVENIDRKIKTDDLINNQQLQNTQQQNQQRDISSSIYSGSVFGNSYLVKKSDGSFVMRTNVGGFYLDTPVSNQNKDNKDNKKGK